jgi:hypothetical protein
MKDVSPAQKDFRSESNDTRAAAVDARIIVSKIRKHVEQDGCQCCKEALKID